MDRIKELIQEFCPDGVPHIPLGELGRFYGGLTGKSKQDFESGNARFISYMNIYSNPAVDVSIEDRVSVAPNERQNAVKKGDVFFTGSSETKEECALSSVLIDDPPETTYLNSFCFGFRLKEPTLFSSVFLKHLLRSSSVRKKLQQTASGVTRYNVSKNKMAKVDIPVPPIAVQSAIATILEEYASYNIELITKLTLEKEARAKQYEYYRNLVLQCDDSYLMPLGDCCDFQNGFAFKSAKFKTSGLPIIRIANIKDSLITEDGMAYFDKADYREDLSRYQVKNGDIVIAMSGATTGKLAQSNTDTVYYINQRVGKFVPKEGVIDNNYLYYVLRSHSKEILKMSEGGAQPNLGSNDIKKMPILVPPIDIQRKIISTSREIDYLFVTLMRQIQEEIELRNKRYRYYSDSLLCFSKV